MNDDLYKTLEKIRNSKTIKLKPNVYSKPDVELRYYQSVAVANMYMIKRMVLGDCMGLGKTITSLTAYTSVLQDNKDLKLIVVCPSSVLYQWASEIDKFCVGITSQIVEAEDIKIGSRVIKGQKSREYQFKQFENNNANVLIFNYNTLRTDFHIISNLINTYNKNVMVIFDEATAFKNHKSQTFEYARNLASLVERVYGLSGTIIKNNLMEAWSIYRVIMPGLFGSIEHFMNTYCVVEMLQLWRARGVRGRKIKKVVGYKNVDHFKTMIYPFFLGRRAEDVDEQLPEIVTNELYIKMNPEQEALYKEIVKGLLELNNHKLLDFNKFIVEEEKQVITAGSVEQPAVNVEDDISRTKYIDKLSAIIYCQQVSNSPRVLGFDIDSSKEEELLRLLSEELKDEKVVVYTRFKKPIDRLEKIVKEKLELECVKITGDVCSSDREANKKRFAEDPNCNIMFINSAAREGINLHCSGRIIFFDLPYSYGDFLQILGRIRRMGSTHAKNFVTYLINKNTVDEKVLKVLMNKKKLFDKVLGDCAISAIRDDTETTINDLFADLLAEAKVLSNE